MKAAHLAIGALLLAGCGGDGGDGGSSNGGGEPAYDEAKLGEVEASIEQRIIETVEDEVGAERDEVRDTTIHCVADTARTFTCTSTVEVLTKDGACGILKSEQRGNFTASGDDFNWKTTGSEDPESC